MQLLSMTGADMENTLAIRRVKSAGVKKKSNSSARDVQVVSDPVT